MLHCPSQRDDLWQHSAHALAVLRLGLPSQFHLPGVKGFSHASDKCLRKSNKDFKTNKVLFEQNKVLMHSYSQSSVRRLAYLRCNSIKVLFFPLT